MEGIFGGVTKKSLYDAAAMGDIKALSDLLKNDPLLLDKVSCTSPNKSPLHIATICGHLTFVQEILKVKPNLAKELDSQQSTALHIASAKGYVEIVSALLEAAPHMCFSRDCQGRNPLHIAVVEGHGSVLEKLVRVVPVAAREKVDRGVGLLHLCVKHKQLEAMKILLVNFSDMINDRDDDGDMVLHVAIRDKQIEIVEYLLTMRNIDVNAKNSKGQTPSESEFFKQNQNSQLKEILKSTERSNSKWGDSLMVVAILIATMAFQAAVTPPGGVLQGNSAENAENEYTARETIIGQFDDIAFKIFIWSNTLAFVLSLSTILLLISGLPFRRKVFTWILRVIMWFTIASIGTTYAVFTYVVTPYAYGQSLATVLMIGIIVWAIVMVILFVGNTVRWLKINGWLKDTGIKAWQSCRNLVKVEGVTFGGATV